MTDARNELRLILRGDKYKIVLDEILEFLPEGNGKDSAPSPPKKKSVPPRRSARR